jgi:hypothetical protein
MAGVRGQSGSCSLIHCSELGHCWKSRLRRKPARDERFSPIETVLPAARVECTNSIFLQRRRFR